MLVMHWCHPSLPIGVYINADVTLRTQVTNTIRVCFAALCQICSVRRSLLQHALLTLIRTLVITQLDQCNSVLVGTFVYLQDWLQSVMNTSAWLVYLRRTSEHTTPLLWELHWLRVPERIQFRLCVLAYHCAHGTAPAYLSDSLRPTSEIVAVFAADTTTLQVPSTRRATLDSGLLLTSDISEGDQVSPFSSVMRLTWCCYSGHQQASTLNCTTV